MVNFCVFLDFLIFVIFNYFSHLIFIFEFYNFQFILLVNGKVGLVVKLCFEILNFSIMFKFQLFQVIFSFNQKSLLILFLLLINIFYLNLNFFLFLVKFLKQILFFQGIFINFCYFWPLLNFIFTINQYFLKINILGKNAFVERVIEIFVGVHF